ncbi:MAG: glutamate racemase, partial [Duncaniella sp.]|nr:glutamate racemase [Duncaniella sp.]
YFVEKYVEQLFGEEPEIDTVVLGCTHYPLLLDKIRRQVGDRAQIVTQGELVAASLKDYLRRHPEMDAKCTKGGNCTYLTTENPAKFTELAEIFLNAPIAANHVTL